MAGEPGLAALVAPLHRALTGETSRLARVIALVDAGDQRSAGPIGAWAFDVVDALDHHLRAVESVVRACAVADDGDDVLVQEVVTSCQRDRRALKAATSPTLAAAVRWQDGATSADRDALVVGLRRLESGSSVAFRRIEGDLAPVADRLVAGAQLRWAGAYAVTALGGRRGAALLGAVLVASPPPPARGARERLRRACARWTYTRRSARLEAVTRSGR